LGSVSGSLTGVIEVACDGKMKTKVLVLAVAWCWVSAARAQIAEPPNPGVYVKVSGQWTMLKPMQAVSGKRRLLKVVIHGQPFEVVWAFRNSHAPVKVLGTSAEVFVRDVPGFSERDVLVVRLHVKKHRRELRMRSSENPSTFKTGFDEAQAPRFEGHRISDHTYSVITSPRLGPGEYMITIAPGSRGYDFTIE